MHHYAAHCNPQLCLCVLSNEGRGRLSKHETATGLNIIGRVGHKLFTNAELEKNWKQYAGKMGDPQTID